MKKALIIAAVVLGVACASLFLAAFIHAGFDFSKLGKAKYETNSYTLKEGFDAIEINATEADVTFKPSNDGAAEVECIEQEKARHEVLVENGTLKISVRDERSWLDRVLVFSTKSQSITVCLPEEHYRALLIDIRTGDVSVPDRFSFDAATITASTGDVVFDASTDGGLKIKTSTGDITLNGTRADSIDLSVSTGRIEGRNVDCIETLSIKVSTGKTVLTDVSCRSLISTGTTGDITLKNVAATDEFNIDRDTGDVRFERCDAGQITVKTTTGDVTGTLSSEKVFSTQTSTGSVKVPKTASGGICEITTSTGKIQIDIAE